MTTKFHSLTVVFDKEIREDDVIDIVNAIKMIKGVLRVVPEVADINLFITKEIAKNELIQKIFKLLEE